jgi:phosphohistidine phosphatase
MNEKILLLMRHGEAQEPYGNQQDVNRELSAKGQADSYKAGQFLTKNDLVPEIVVCSAAKRAYQTAELLCSQTSFQKEDIQVEESLYQASLGVIFTKIQELPNHARIALIVAHNPTLTYLSEYLTEENHNLLPATCVCIKFSTSNWNLISKGQGSVIWIKEQW